MEETRKKSLERRDQLAVERTNMANERTLMAYVRTSFLLFAGGISLIKLYPGIAFLKVLGILLLPMSVVIALVSIFRYYKIKRRIERECQ